MARGGSRGAYIFFSLLFLIISFTFCHVPGSEESRVESGREEIEMNPYFCILILHSPWLLAVASRVLHSLCACLNKWATTHRGVFWELETRLPQISCMPSVLPRKVVDERTKKSKCVCDGGNYREEAVFTSCYLAVLAPSLIFLSHTRTSEKVLVY